METSDAQECVTKTCTKCGETKPITSFTANKRGAFGKMSQCKKCRAESAKDYRTKNPEAAKESCLKYYVKHKHEIDHKRRTDSVLRKKRRDSLNRWKNLNRDLKKQHDIRARKKGIEELKNWYIRNLILISGRTQYKDIPKEIFELKREQLNIHRAIKQQRQIIKEVSNAK